MSSLACLKQKKYQLDNEYKSIQKSNFENRGLVGIHKILTGKPNIYDLRAYISSMYGVNVFNPTTLKKAIDDCQLLLKEIDMLKLSKKFSCKIIRTQSIILLDIFKK